MSNDVRSQWADIQSGYVRDYCVLVVLLHSHTPCLQKQTNKLRSKASLCRKEILWGHREQCGQPDENLTKQGRFLHKGSLYSETTARLNG